ncbi:MAG: sugar ABC transporter substrate-binding protein [Acetivibrionales bacterium]|jgi:ribose transport system substrate-binding protein
MKKSWSVVMALLLVFALVFGLVACTTQEPGTQAKEKPAESKPEANGADEKSADESKPADEIIKIGMSTLDLSNPFFVALTDAAKKYGEEHGVEIMINDSQDKAERQVEALENFIASGAKAIIVTAVDPAAVLPVVKNARAQGVKVVCHTTRLDEYDAWVAADEYDMGYTLGTAAGKWIAENWGTEETVEAATLNFDIIPQVINRKKGIMEGVAEFAPNVKFVADTTAGDPQAGMEAAENFIQAHPNLQVVLGINDGGALGAYEAFMSANMKGDRYLIGGIDATPEGLNKVKEGGIYRITVDQNPTVAGSKCVELALKAIKGEPYEKDYLQELKAVTAENIDEYIN